MTGRAGPAALWVNGLLRLAPLRNLPVIKDLVTDMTEFFDKWQKAGGVFKAREPENPEFSTITPDTPARQKVDAAIECINCGICYAACSMVTANKDYLGPAALNRSWSLLNDVRDGGNAERLRQAASEGGCRTCHSHQDCAEFCPKSLNPTASIAGLKRRMLGEFIKGRL